MCEDSRGLRILCTFSVYAKEIKYMVAQKCQCNVQCAKYVCNGDDNARVRLKYVNVHCLHVFSFVKRKICSFTVEVGKRSFGCDKQCRVPPEICLRRSSCGNMIVYDRVATRRHHPTSWFPGSERCERDASCQVELVLVSMFLPLPVSVKSTEVFFFFSVLHDKHRVRSKFT